MAEKTKTKRGRQKTSGIPYPANTKEYWIVRSRMKSGETLEQALIDIDKRRPHGTRGKGPGKPVPASPVKKKALQVPTGTVPAADLLNHPDVPDRVKEAIRVSEEAVREASSTATPGPRDPPPTPVPAQDPINRSGRAGTTANSNRITVS